MAEAYNYPLLTTPITVVGPQFCVPYPIELAIVKKVLSLGAGNFSVADVDGNIIFKVKAIPFNLHQRHLLLDANGNPLLSMQRKCKTQLDVFLAGCIREEICDFKIKGSWLERSCKIYLGESTNIVAQMHKKFTGQSVFFGKLNFMVIANPNVDYAFIVTVIVILNAIRSAGSD